MKLISDCTECNNGIYESDLFEVIEKGTQRNGFIAEESNINIYKCSKCNNELYAGGETEKTHFEQMELEQQVEHINKLLETPLSLTKACESVGIARKTLSGQFERAGYKLDTTIKPNKYIKSSTSNNSNTIKATEKAQNKHKSSNSNNTLEKRVGSLEKELEQLKAIINTITTQSNNSNTSNNSSNTTNATIITDIKTYETINLVPRTFKIDNEVQQAFKQFCKAHSEHKVSDLVTNALIEYMNKFK